MSDLVENNIKSQFQFHDGTIVSKLNIEFLLLDSNASG